MRELTRPNNYSVIEGSDIELPITTEDENIIEGLELTEEIRKKAIDNIQKSIFVDKEGNKYSAIQKYEKENPSVS